MASNVIQKLLRLLRGGGRVAEPDQANAGSTTRVTIVIYTSEDGERHFEIPGWGPSVPVLLKTGIDITTVLGQLYMERPYRTYEEAPNEFTSVDMRSLSGLDRMVQEFSGHISDHAEITKLVHQRLGLEMSRWRIVESTMLRRKQA